MNKGKTKPVFVILSVAFVALAGFWLFPVSPPSTPPPAPSLGWSPPGPQGKLPTIKLRLGSQELVAEIARRPPEIATGLMFRTNMANGEGMLFVLPATQQAAFYMRNTLIPLSCAYLDDEGVVLELHDMEPKDETPIPSAAANVRYVIEANRGWFDTNHIKPGILVRTEKGSLSDLLYTN